jgi:hypothetical protein
MRFVAAVAAAAMLMPVTLSVTHAGVSTELSAAAKMKKKKSAAPKVEYLKAAPGTGPSGPAPKK